MKINILTILFSRVQKDLVKQTSPSIPITSIFTYFLFKLF